VYEIRHVWTDYWLQDLAARREGRSVRQAQVDTGQRAGVSTDEPAELKRLRRATPNCAGPTKS
jgi:hypothetical protein